MIEAFLSFLIVVLVVCTIAGIILWAVARLVPEVYPPTRLVVGAIALVYLLLQLVKLMGSGLLSL